MLVKHDQAMFTVFGISTKTAKFRNVILVTCLLVNTGLASILVSCSPCTSWLLCYHTASGYKLSLENYVTRQLIKTL